MRTAVVTALATTALVTAGLVVTRDDTSPDRARFCAFASAQAAAYCPNADAGCREWAAATEARCRDTGAFVLGDFAMGEFAH